MLGRYLWADGRLSILPALSKKSHKDMLPEGRVTNLAAGEFHIDEMHGPQFDAISMLWQRGETPNETELLYMIQLETDGGRESARQKYIQTLAVNTEDTEPQGENVGFLRDPHKTLYPYLFPDGGETMPEKVRHLLKSHVLNQLEDAFADPDNFIYFTVYGSGVAYNWDEGGDLDVQMWIDLEKFQSLNDDKAEWTMDELLAEVRRNVQLVNFPTVKDIGLIAPQNTEEEITGEMLVQYYPKPGKGTKEENLAQKPYSCLDLETGKWIVNPEPIEPTFYGLHFIDLLPKATDMALQAEALLDEYERNILNWQFWFSLYSRYQNNEYQKQYQEAQRNAIMEKQGIKTMFKGIFGGRQDAYSPEGKGIEDERDMLQKLLEVWGVFQRLKHYSRAPLPWEELDLPAPPENISEGNAQSYTDEQDRYAADDSEDFSVRHVPIIARLRKSGNQQILDANRGSDLQGLPGAVRVPGHGRLQFGSHGELQNLANQYAFDSGLPYNPPREYAKVDPTRAKRIADEYDKAPHAPNDPKVKASYDAFKNETMQQYNALKNAGYTFDFYPSDHDPYPNSPREAVMDLHNNKHLYVYPTESGFGTEAEDSVGHPLLQVVPGVQWSGKPVTYNDIFRGVHDVFGHAKEGVGFRADGEENAWRQHAAMYSDVARPAMTAETRGQNSWVNFGPYAEQNQNANQADTVYADQKATILPDWVHREGDHDHNWRTATWRVESAIYEEELWVEPKITMADRSGIPEIDSLIEQFLQTPQGEWTTDTAPIEVLRNPELAHGMCEMVTEQFVAFAKEHGFKAFVTQADLDEMGYEITGEPHGEVLDEVGEIIPGHYHEHTIATIVLDDPAYSYGREFYIDFTATQYGYTDHPKVTTSVIKTAAWADVMAKAQRIRDAGGVQLQRNGQQHIIGTVASGTRQGVEYNPEIWRQSPDRNTISLWDCTCEWSGFSWGRTRQWKKYEGRPCAHVLALYWESLSQPLDDVDQNTQLQIPGLDPYANQPPPTPTSYPQQPTPIDLNQALQQTVAPPPQMPQPQMPQNAPIIEPTKPKQPEQMTITFPGAISSWRKQGALQNGDYARVNMEMIGFDDRGTQHRVPRNSIVEIIWSDPKETIAIYSLGSGPLGPHNARIVGPTEAFSWVPRTRGTAPKRH